MLCGWVCGVWCELRIAGGRGGKTSSWRIDEAVTPLLNDDGYKVLHLHHNTQRWVVFNFVSLVLF